MAVAYDNDTQALNQVSVSSVTFSHTTAGSNRAILVAVALTGTAQTVSSITYAGTTLSLLGAQNNTSSLPARVELWGLTAAATGANNVVVTLSASNAAWDASAISFTGAHQTQASAFTGLQSATTSSASAATLSVTVTTGATGDMVADATVSTNDDGTAPGTGQTQQWLDNSGSTNTMGSTKAGAASVTMTENWINPTVFFSMIAVNVAQVAVTLFAAAFQQLTSSGGMVGRMYV